MVRHGTVQALPRSPAGRLVKPAWATVQRTHSAACVRLTLFFSKEANCNQNNYTSTWLSLLSHWPSYPVPPPATPPPYPRQPGSACCLTDPVPPPVPEQKLWDNWHSIRPTQIVPVNETSRQWSQSVNITQDLCDAPPPHSEVIGSGQQFKQCTTFIVITAMLWTVPFCQFRQAEQMSV